MSDLVTEFWPVQPEPGSVADQLIKKGEARGIALGEARGITLGEKRASIKTIRMLQSILGMPESAEEEFTDYSIAELDLIIETLRSKISNRPAT